MSSGGLKKFTGFRFASLVTRLWVGPSTHPLNSLSRTGKLCTHKVLMPEDVLATGYSGGGLLSVVGIFPGELFCGRIARKSRIFYLHDLPLELLGNITFRRKLLDRLSQFCFQWHLAEACMARVIYHLNIWLQTNIHNDYINRRISLNLSKSLKAPQA